MRTHDEGKASLPIDAVGLACSLRKSSQRSLGTEVCKQEALSPPWKEINNDPND